MLEFTGQPSQTPDSGGWAGGVCGRVARARAVRTACRRRVTPSACASPDARLNHSSPPLLQLGRQSSPPAWDSSSRCVCGGGVVMSACDEHMCAHVHLRCGAHAPMHALPNIPTPPPLPRARWRRLQQRLSRRQLPRRRRQQRRRRLRLPPSARVGAGVGVLGWVGGRVGLTRPPTWLGLTRPPAPAHLDPTHPAARFERKSGEELGADGYWYRWTEVKGADETGAVQVRGSGGWVGLCLYQPPLSSPAQVPSFC